MSDYGLVASSGGFLEVGDEGLGRLAYSRGEGLCSQRKKIKGLKRCLRLWSKEQCGDIKSQCQLIGRRMDDLDIKEEVEGLEEQELILRRELQDEFWRVTSYHSVLVANEVVEDAKRRKKKFLNFKI